jgi:hypothetical protein
MTAIFFQILYACPNVPPGQDGSCPFQEIGSANLMGEPGRTEKD